MNKERIKKIWNIFLNVIMYVFLTLCVFTVFITISARRATDGGAEILGYQMRVVTTDSMAKCEYTDVSDYDIKHIPVRSMVFVKTMPRDKDKADDWYRSVKVGDVLTFRYVYTTQVTITHRVTSITEKDSGGFIIELKGDNVNSEDGALTQVIDTSVPNNMNYVIGKVTAKSYLIGLIISFLMTPIGMVLVIMVPCFIIILLEVIKIVGMLNADKRKKDRDAAEETEKELLELKRKLAELESKKTDAEDEPAAEETASESAEESADTAAEDAE